MDRQEIEARGMAKSLRRAARAADRLVAILADDPTPRLPQQHPRYVAGFSAGAEWARETDAALAADSYGGDPDDDPVDLTRTTNPDGTRTPRDEELDSPPVPTPEELVEALRIVSNEDGEIASCPCATCSAVRTIAAAVREVSWALLYCSRKRQLASNLERYIAAEASAEDVLDMQ